MNAFEISLIIYGSFAFMVFCPILEEHGLSQALAAALFWPIWLVLIAVKGAVDLWERILR